MRYRDHVVKLTSFLFLPLWLLLLVLTYVSAHAVDRPPILVLALYVAALVGVVTVGAPLAKLWMLRRRGEESREISLAAIVGATILEAIMMLIAVFIATWAIAFGGPVHGLYLGVQEELLFASIFIVGTGLLALLPNLALLLSKGRRLQNARSAPGNLLLAFAMGLIAPFTATLVFTGFILLTR